MLNNYLNTLKTLMGIMGTLTISSVTALTFSIAEDSDLVGKLQTTIVQEGQTLSDIGRRYNIGVYEMIEANPNLSPWNPMVGARVIIPSEFILPPGKRQGIVINLAEMRIYYFHPHAKVVTTHPIGVGKKGWRTPLGNLKVIEKVANPTWRPPKSIRADHAKHGDILPTVVPPGPENPLGKYAMRLSIPSYLIHGTNKPGGIGFRSTSGCIRLLPEDIATLYPQIPVGTSVRIMHVPYKFGRKGYNIFLEAHQPLSEHAQYTPNTTTTIRHALESSALGNLNIDFSAAEKTISATKGYPVLVY